MDRPQQYLYLDTATRRHLELTTNFNGQHDHTLLQVLDHTATNRLTASFNNLTLSGFNSASNVVNSFMHPCPESRVQSAILAV